MAGMQAVAPGSVSTSIPASAQVRASRNPGSLMPGVPASEISATESPARIFSLMRCTVSCSFHLWWLSACVVMPKCLSSTPLVRVSSASIKSTLCSTSTALGVISPRLPTGVGTM